MKLLGVIVAAARRVIGARSSADSIDVRDQPDYHWLDAPTQKPVAKRGRDGRYLRRDMRAKK